MNSFDKDKMNYDESGLYPDEVPKQRKEHPVFEKIMSGLVLIWIIGTVIALISAAALGAEPWQGILILSQVFAAVGLLALISDLVSGDELQTGAFLALGIGTTGIVLALLLRTADTSDAITTAKHLIPVVPLALLLTGAGVIAKMIQTYFIPPRNSYTPMIPDSPQEETFAPKLSSGAKTARIILTAVRFIFFAVFSGWLLHTFFNNIQWQ